MKTIYHIYFDCSGAVLIGESSTVSNSEIPLSSATFIDVNGIEHALNNCIVNKNRIAFYYVERIFD